MLLPMMNIAYLLSTTLIDYPGKVAAVCFTTGCNFRCPFCHNCELVLPEKIETLKLIPENEVLYFLRERRGFLDGLVITGGEPTVQPGLFRFIERVKGLGLLVKLDTNGSWPEVLEELLAAHLLDYIAMDLKGPAARYDEMAGVHVDMAAITRSIRLIIERAPNYEFRTTTAPTMTAKDIKEAVSLIAGAKRYYLQQFVVPPDKDLVDPAWNQKTALPERELRALWERIKGNFAAGGVR